MARPKKNDYEKCTEMVRVRLTQNEKIWLAHFANRKNMKKSEYIRMLLNREFEAAEAHYGYETEENEEEEWS